MQYGTIKTEVWAHNHGSAQEYYRYAIITRWWITNPEAYENDDYSTKNEDEWPVNNTDIEWETHAVRVKRNGACKVLNADDSEVYLNWLQFMGDEKTKESNPSAARRMMIRQHKTLTDYLLG